jgi:hypothetical protein
MRTRLLLPAVAVLAASALIAASTRQRVVRPPAPVLSSGPTFNNEIVRIFQERCQTCHHPGDIAPFSLMTYREAAPFADAIKYMTQTRRMPPWKATSGCGEFVDARTMPQHEIDLIAQWADNGAPEGRPADLPAPLQFTSDWTLGQPDMVLSNTEAFTPPARGDEYRCFTLPANTTSTSYVSAIDVHPGDRRSVHHVIAFLDETGASVALDEKDPAPGYQCFGDPGFATTGTLGGWAPGYRAVKLPPEVAYQLPANSRVVLQVHYHVAHGNPSPDRTEIGIYFADAKPRQTMRIVPIINQGFTIPPNDPNYRVTGSIPLPTALIPSMRVWFVAPHMHLLGRKMKVEAALENGETKCLINIDDWDFNWQGLYLYKEPIKIPARTRFSFTAYYDNSTANLRNPNNPPKPVYWGEATTDEMALAFIGVTLDAEDLTQNIKADDSWIPPLH